MKRFWCVIILIVLAALFQTVSAGWIRIYGGDGKDEGRCAQPTPDGGFIITVCTQSFDLLKTDSLGHTLWTKLYPNGSAQCVQNTSDGCYISTGSMESASGVHYMWLLKTNADGDSLWSRIYESDWRLQSGTWVEETNDGGYIIVGDKPDPMNGIWLRKTDEVGEELWYQIYGDSDGVEQASCVKQTSDGGYIVTARILLPSFPPPPKGTIWLLKTDSQGDSMWAKTYGGESKGDIACPGNVIVTPDGGYVVGGYRQFDSTSTSVFWLLKTDAQGDTLWTRTYGEEGEVCVCEWVDVTSEGGYILAGWTTSFGAGGADFLMIKTDENGGTLWTRTYGGTGYERCHHVRQTLDGGYILIGETDSYGAGLDDAWLIKTDSTGSLAVTEPPVTPPVTHPSTHQPDWQVTPIGSRIVLRYSGSPEGFRASFAVFDATGHKVNEIRTSGSSGSITWGKGISPGVYFIRETAIGSKTQKVILVR